MRFAATQVKFPQFKTEIDEIVGSYQSPTVGQVLIDSQLVLTMGPQNMTIQLRPFRRNIYAGRFEDPGLRQILGTIKVRVLSKQQGVAQHLRLYSDLTEHFMDPEGGRVDIFRS